MTILFEKDGYKYVENSGIADNSGGTATATIDVPIRFEEISKITAVISVIVTGGATVESISGVGEGDTLTVTVNVPAGKTSTVIAVVKGY